MKLIIIIQTLIIIAGGYYVYLLTHPNEVVIDEAPATLTIPVVEPGQPREGYTPPTENPPMDASQSDSAVTGHSDVGMEYPTLDADSEAKIQVQ